MWGPKKKKKAITSLVSTLNVKKENRPPNFGTFVNKVVLGQY